MSRDFECLTEGDSVFLTSGTWDFSDVVTSDGVFGFVNQTSSLSCLVI